MKLICFQKQLFKSHLRNVRDKIAPNKKRADRHTVVFLEGSSEKKNLAYHDKSVYNILKIRKQTQV